MSAAPIGAPAWPFPGGLLEQPAKLVAAFEVLRKGWMRQFAAAIEEKKRGGSPDTQDSEAR